MTLDTQVMPVPVNTFSIISSFMIPSILIILVIMGIILLIKSKNIQSKLLKIGILIPLIIFSLGIIWWVGDEILKNPLGIDFDGYILTAILFLGTPLSIISIICSGISLLKLENKLIPVMTIIYGIIYLIISLLSLFSFRSF